jgi:hypothetical protein
MLNIHVTAASIVYAMVQWKEAVKHCGTSAIRHAACRNLNNSLNGIFTTQKYLAVTPVLCSENETELRKQK